LYDMRARDYDPTSGRFIATDPVQVPTGMPFVAGYSYAFNNPLMFTDPSGLTPYYDPNTGTLGTEDFYADGSYLKTLLSMTPSTYAVRCWEQQADSGRSAPPPSPSPSPSASPKGTDLGNGIIVNALVPQPFVDELQKPTNGNDRDLLRVYVNDLNSHYALLADYASNAAKARMDLKYQQSMKDEMFGRYFDLSNAPELYRVHQKMENADSAYIAGATLLTICGYGGGTLCFLYPWEAHEIAEGGG
jgi:hypothetical protein